MVEKRDQIEYLWSATRDDWRNSDGNPAPLLGVYIGPAGGVLTCEVPDGLVHTAGGPGSGPVMCHMDKYSANLFPPGTAIPVDQMITAIREFLNTPSLPQSTEWTEWDIINGTRVYFDDDGNETARTVGDEIIEATS